ncbi:effector protein CiaD [Campylobacter estrildidarum]|uniref:2-oxoglutarate:acceptor oxidoreductase n=1 Tax=Campylobacter estrildidarum TaxID=2510189 RepID=A0A4U7BMT6_9BACT|nr:2-oxoglutarate:acceptor oxidoreductase [Campylobacter estrildidarum]TKX29944.1 2-oxoglutarate:acceptor oxidoreductase [Campylobacter estrildidarum]
MNLEDLAKKTISEVSSIMEEQQRQDKILKEQEEEIKQDKPFKEADELVVEEAHSVLEDKISMVKLEEQILQETIENETMIPSVLENKTIDAKTSKFNEDIFFKNLRERILVLFEGLNSVKKEDLESRLNLTTNFLEFLLANIEDRLKK